MLVTLLFAAARNYPVEMRAEASAKIDLRSVLLGRSKPGV